MVKASRAAHDRRGINTFELLTATALLGFAVVAIGKTTMQTQNVMRHQEARARARTELANAVQTIKSWQMQQISADRIQQLQLSSELLAVAPDANWACNCQSISTPLEAIEVHLTLQWSRSGTATNFEELTFWIPAEESTTELLP